MSWSAKQYVAFEDERTRPVRDLLAALPDIDARSVVDIGCGPGNSTEVLAARFPHAQVSGIDSSPDMIAAARQRLPAASFAARGRAKLERARPLRRDSGKRGSAVGAQHETLLPALIAKLAPGGALAVQMPDNLEEPAHRLMREIAGDGPWAGKLAQAAAARTVLAERAVVLRAAAAAVLERRHVANHLLSRAGRRRGGRRGVVQGQRTAAFPRALERR